MNGSLRWIAAAAAVILIAVVGFAVLGRPSDSKVSSLAEPDRRIIQFARWPGSRTP